MKKINKSDLTDGVIGGTLSLTVATLFVKVLGLIYKIPLSYILGDSGMGYFNSAYTLYSLFYIISVSGVPKAVTLLVSESRAQGDIQAGEKIYKVSLKMFAMLGFIITVLLVLLSSPLAELIGNRNSAPSLILIAPSIVFTSVTGVMRGYLCANMKFSYIARSQVIDALGKTVLGIALALLASKLGMDEKYVSAYTVLGAALGTCFSFVYLFAVLKKEEKHNNSKQNCDKSTDNIKIIKNVIKIALPLTLSALAVNLTNLIDLALIMKRLISAGYSEMQANSLYGNYTTMVTPMLNLVNSFVAPITVSVMPALALAYVQKNREDFDSKMKLAFKIVSFLACPMFFGLTFYSKEVLTLIFNDSGALSAAPLLSICASSVLFMAMNSLLITALEACGCIKAPIIITLSSSVIKVLISYTLIGNKDFGISGAAIGTVAFYVVSFIIGGLFLLIKCKVSLPFFSALAIPFMNSVFMILISNFVLSKFAALKSEEISALVTIILCALTYGILTFVTNWLPEKGKIIRQNALKNRQKII